MSEGTNWLGRARPVNDTPAAFDYWCTGTSMKDLVARYAPGTSLAKFSKIAGPAVIELKCEDCGALHIATSRAKANDTIGWDAEGRRRKQEDRFYRCSGCDSAYRAKKLRDDWRKSEERQQRAEELRWMPYRDYLGTDEWSERRKRVIRRAGFRCQVCASGSRLHVHHRTYARRGVERIEDMIALCADCHELFHRHGKLAESGRAA
jgi:5-methylcytosine-specific restriction endonuclease McrA